ncbi:sterile alpha motif domain-containing protein 1-like [Schistocerca gregaria]|uniref:sterile alpha motif domain-containing protein 1-like n=1 Tax=Schistocerca gregaria TaxID=7010 RepID=UPI00211F45A0|nr:sterile alpha motif domain-containing protein 1-like [Schistocerca gregaria]
MVFEGGFYLEGARGEYVRAACWRRCEWCGVEQFGGCRAVPCPVLAAAPPVGLDPGCKADAAAGTAPLATPHTAALASPRRQCDLDPRGRKRTKQLRAPRLASPPSRCSCWQPAPTVALAPPPPPPPPPPPSPVCIMKALRAR